MKKNTATTNNSERQFPIVWLCILRSETLLVKATAPDRALVVAPLARTLLQRKVTTGWDEEILRPSRTLSTAPRTPKYRAIKFHILHDDDDNNNNNNNNNNNEVSVWTYACIYDARLLKKVHAKAFVEKSLIAISENFRTRDGIWSTGGHLSCQEKYSPIFYERMEQIRCCQTSLERCTLTLSTKAIQNNQAILKKCNASSSSTGRKVQQRKEKVAKTRWATPRKEPKQDLKSRQNCTKKTKLSHRKNKETSVRLRVPDGTSSRRRRSARSLSVTRRRVSSENEETLKTDSDQGSQSRHKKTNTDCDAKNVETSERKDVLTKESVVLTKRRVRSFSATRASDQTFAMEEHQPITRIHDVTKIHSVCALANLNECYAL